MTDTAPDVAAIRAALAQGPTPGPWKHKRHADVMVGGLRLCHVNAAAKLGIGADVERGDVNAAYIAACHPERIARLLDALEAATKDAELWRWFRANFTTSPATVGLHACQTSERLEAHITAAMKATT
jgi:hypothetical protein